MTFFREPQRRTGHLRKSRNIFDSHTQVNFFGNFFRDFRKLVLNFFRRELDQPTSGVATGPMGATRTVTENLIASQFQNFQVTRFSQM